MTNDFRGIARVVTAVHDSKAAVARYQKAHCLLTTVQQIDTSFGGKIAMFSGTPAVLAEPSKSAIVADRLLQQVGEGPCAFILGDTRTSSINPC